MLLHGLIDAALWYNDLTRVFVFIPMAVTLAGLGVTETRDDHIWIGGTVGAVILFALVIISRPMSALWYANLGSLSQTNLELRQYKFPERLVEYTRRDGDLTGAENYFREAQSRDLDNVTANQRLALIALARRDYEAALALAQTAQQGDVNNTTTWQILGDAHLALGQLDNAYTYWSRLDDAPNRLLEEVSVRYAPLHDGKRIYWAKKLAERIRSERYGE
jgi:tetratricopeptide (TPR) repeat protein